MYFPGGFNIKSKFPTTAPNKLSKDRQLYFARPTTPA